jgi:outer membrane immunogenic protein
MRKFTTTAMLSILAIGLAGSGQAADMISPYPAANWDGFYAGANIGYSTGIVDHDGSAIGDLTTSGALFGGQLGYNFSTGNGVVVGVQGDLDLSNATGLYNGPPGPDITQSIAWEGSLTGHVGYDLGGIMPYVLAGVTAIQTTRAASFGPTETAFLGGLTVGGGAEYKVSDSLSVFGEARYNNYGSHIYNSLPTTPVVALSTAEVRGGMNFHF